MLEVVPDHISPPDGIELRQSEIDETLIGAWCHKPMKVGTIFGPFVGEIVTDYNEKLVDYRFAWEIYNLDTSEVIHYLNATNPKKGNWMRYVNCARYLEEQNLVSVQEGTQIYYKVIKDIEEGEELLIWFEPFKKRRKSRKQRNSVNDSKDSAFSDTSSLVEEKEDGKPKRTRKKKKMFDEEVFLSDFPKRRKRSASKVKDIDAVEDKSNKKQTKNKSNVKVVSSKNQTDMRTKENEDQSDKKSEVKGDNLNDKKVKTKEETQTMKKTKTKEENQTKSKKKEKEEKIEIKQEVEETRKQNSTNSEDENVSKVIKKEKTAMKNKGKTEKFDKNNVTESKELKNEQLKSVSQENNNGDSVEANWVYPEKEQEYQFDLQSTFAIVSNGRRMYKCDICSGIYRHTFSLKRHYLRNHINCRYLSQMDIGNCMISISQQHTAILNANDSQTLKKVDQFLAKKSNEDSPVKEEKKPSKSIVMPGLYCCHDCYKLFEYVEELITHTQDHPPVHSEKQFACDKCHMRFPYKQNLVRHKLVHEGDRKPQKKETKADKKEKVEIPLAAAGKSGGKPFACSSCNMRFKYIVNLKKHEPVHSADRPFVCTSCGKAFPSATNLKKHIHIAHVGSKVPCKFCSAVFNHVGRLRKHIRVDHPEIHRQRLLKLLDKRGKLSPKAAQRLEETYKNVKETAKASTSTKSKENEQKADQGENEFQYACVVCKKRFNTYITMCRHRRMAHRHLKKVEESKEEKVYPVGKSKSIETILRKENVLDTKQEENNLPELSEEPIDNSPEAIAEFYANVANNIADNLNFYIDGGESSLTKFRDHIRIHDYESVFEVKSVENLEPDDFKLDRFNFPTNYDKTVLENNFVSFEDVKLSDIKTSVSSSSIDMASFRDKPPGLCTRRRSSRDGSVTPDLCNNSRDGFSYSSRDESASNSRDCFSNSSRDGLSCQENSQKSSNVTVEIEKESNAKEESDIFHAETKGSNSDNKTYSVDDIESAGANGTTTMESQNEKDVKNENENSIDHTSQQNLKRCNDLEVEPESVIERNNQCENDDCEKQGQGCKNGCEKSCIKSGEVGISDATVQEKNTETESESCENEEITKMEERQNEGCTGSNNCYEGCKKDVTANSDEAIKKVKQGDTLLNQTLDSEVKKGPGNFNISEINSEIPNLSNSKLCEELQISEHEKEGKLSEKSKENLDSSNDVSKKDTGKKDDSSIFKIKCGSDIDNSEQVQVKHETVVMENSEISTSTTDINFKEKSLESKTDVKMTLQDKNCKDGKCQLSQGNVSNLQNLDKNQTEGCLLETNQAKMDDNQKCVRSDTKNVLDMKDDGRQNSSEILDSIEKEDTEAIECEEIGCKKSDMKVDSCELKCEKSEVKEGSGEFKCEEKWCDKSKMKVDSGESKSEEIGCEKSEVKVDSGELKCEGKGCEKVEVKVDSGELKCEGKGCEKSEVQVDSSELKCEEIGCEKSEMKINSGESKSEEIGCKLKPESNEMRNVHFSREGVICKDKNLLSGSTVVINDAKPMGPDSDVVNIVNQMDNSEDVDNDSDGDSSGVLLMNLSSDSGLDSDDPDFTSSVLKGLELSKSPGKNFGENSSLDILSTVCAIKSEEMRKSVNLPLGSGERLEKRANSPQHPNNYETIAFGKHGQVSYVCSVCIKHFREYDLLVRHQIKKHPSIYCHHLEVEEGHEIEYLYYAEPCNIGVLGMTGKALEPVIDKSNYTCTRCYSTFKNVDRLRIHIINCAPKPVVQEPSEEKPKRKYKRKLKKMDSFESDEKKVSESMSGSAKTFTSKTDNTGSQGFNKVKVKKRRFMGCRKRKVVSIPDTPECSPVKILKKRGKSIDLRYNPGNHVRRRELTEVLDKHQCNGCGVKFKTISLLERHVKKCDRKEKFKDLKVMKSQVNETFHKKLKHVCLYCNKGFTYPKTLMNHYKAFCLVKKDKVKNGCLGDDERREEMLMMVRLKQQDEDRSFRKSVDIEMGPSNVKKGGWPKGVKRKLRRKGHSWTTIKKRKVSTEDDVDKDKKVVSSVNSSDDSKMKDNQEFSTDDKDRVVQSNQDENSVLVTIKPAKKKKILEKNSLLKSSKKLLDKSNGNGKSQGADSKGGSPKKVSLSPKVLTVKSPKVKNSKNADMKTVNFFDGNISVTVLNPKALSSPKSKSVSPKKKNVSLLESGLPDTASKSQSSNQSVQNSKSVKFLMSKSPGAKTSPSSMNIDTLSSGVNSSDEQALDVQAARRNLQSVLSGVKNVTAPKQKKNSSQSSILDDSSDQDIAKKSVNKTGDDNVTRYNSSFKKDSMFDPKVLPESFEPYTTAGEKLAKKKGQFKLIPCVSLSSSNQGLDEKSKMTGIKNSTGIPTKILAVEIQKCEDNPSKKCAIKNCENKQISESSPSKAATTDQNSGKVKTQNTDKKTAPGAKVENGMSTPTKCKIGNNKSIKGEVLTSPDKLNSSPISKKKVVKKIDLKNQNSDQNTGISDGKKPSTSKMTNDKKSGNASKLSSCNASRKNVDDLKEFVVPSAVSDKKSPKRLRLNTKTVYKSVPDSPQSDVSR